MWSTLKPVVVAFLVFVLLTIGAILVEKVFGTTKLLILGFGVCLIVLTVVAWSEVVSAIRPLLIESKSNYRIGLGLSIMVAVVVGVLFHFAWQYLALSEPASPPLSVPSAYIKITDLIAPDRDKMGSTPWLNVRFENSGDAQTRGQYLGVAVFSEPPPADKQTALENRLAEIVQQKFQWKEEKTWSLSSRDHATFTVRSDPLSEEKLALLLSSQRVMYFVGLIRYRNGEELYESRFCAYIQGPNNVVFRCKDGIEEHILVKPR